MSEMNVGGLCFLKHKKKKKIKKNNLYVSVKTLYFVLGREKT